MARARNIKPGFFRNADLVELPFEARLLFIGLWTLADREGRLEDRPKQIKMEIFPADNVDCDALIEQLASIGVVARYAHDGKRYLQVVNFCKHQNPHRDEKASTIPDQNGNITPTKEAREKHGANTVQAQCNSDADTVAIGLIPDSLIPEVNPPLPPLQGGEAGIVEIETDHDPDAIPLQTEGAEPKRLRKSSEATTFCAWLSGVKERGEKPISEYEALWTYADSVSLPHEYVELAWFSFADHYRSDEKAKRKRYADWKGTFLNAVKGNYRKLWFWSDRDGAFRLTTAGQQLDMALQAKEAA